MRITRIIALLTALILAFSLAACDDNGKDGGKQNGGQEGTGGTENGGSENGEAGESGESGENSGNENGGENTENTVLTYVYSIITKSIHLSDCYHVNRINEDYKKEFVGDVNELLAKGDDYTLCKDCLDIKEDIPE